MENKPLGRRKIKTTAGISWIEERHAILNWQSLRVRIIAVFTLTLALLVATIAVFILYFVINAETNSWKERQAETAQAVSGVISGTLQHNQSYLYILESLVGSNDFRFRLPMDKFVSNNPSLIEVNVLTDTGKVIFSEAKDFSFLTNPFTTMQSVWFQQALAGNPYLGEIQRSENEIPYLILAIPAMEEKGVIVARLDLRILQEIFDEIRIGRNGYAYLINRNGLMVAHPDDPSLPDSLNLKNRPEITAMLKHQQGMWSGVYRNFKGKTVFGSSFPIPNTQWILVTEIPLLEAYRSTLQASVGIVIGLGILFLLVMFTILRTMHKVLFQPIENLRAGAFRIADGDLDHLIPVGREDELGEVALALNTMSVRLKERNQELEAQSISLAAEAAERQKAQEQLLYDAFHDSLTHLANRALLMERLRRSLLRVKNQRGKSSFALLFIDFDRFKNINDSLGHLIGDQLLIQIAQRLQQCVRATDTIARLGADEFAILIEDINHIRDATGFAERLFDILGEPYLIGEHDISITFSTGIVISSANYENAEDILRDADTALHRAKRNGKARYEIFDVEMRQHIIEHLSLENDLRKAIETHQFDLHYQPIIDLSHYRIHGFEALVRWQHPMKGLIRPDRFIPIAEETGLIVPMGQMIFFKAAQQLKQWQKIFSEIPIKMSVNLSRRQLVYEGLVEDVESILSQFDISPECLCLEVTETAFMYDLEAGKRAIHQLKRLGVEIHLDDFGTGYSSLSQLSLLPFDVVKIDKYFIERMLSDEKQAGLVRSIISISHELGLEVIAEGVETEEQVEILRKLGCEYGQGYLFARPQESQAIENLIYQIMKHPAPEDYAVRSGGNR